MQRQTSKSRLYRRLLFYFSSISLIPVVLLGILALVTANRLAVGNVIFSLEQMAETAARMLNNELIKYRNSINLFCEDDQLFSFLETEDFPPDQITRINQKVYLIMAGHADTLNFFIVDAAGRFKLSTSYEPVEYDRERYQTWGIFRAMDQQEGALFYPGRYTDKYGQEDSGITVCRKVSRDGKTLGYVMLNICRQAIQEMLPPVYDMQVNYAVADKNYFLVMNQFLPSRNPFLPERYRPLMRTRGEVILTRNYPDEKRMISGCFLPEAGLVLMAEVSTALMMKNSVFINSTVIAVTILFVMICIFFAHKIASRILKPIQTICGSMEIIKDGNLNERVRINTGDEFELMADGLNRMIEQLDTQFKTDMERQNRLRIAEIKNLQAQIAPHFLYNTLESIKWLAKLGMNAEIQTMVEKLGILLKSRVNFKKDMIPLREEMRVVTSYIAIQQIRYEDQFTVKIDIEESLLDCMVPNLIIQPVVENALVHGIEKKVGEGSLVIRGFYEGDLIHIEICDNGPGISREQLATIMDEKEGAGDQGSIGLINVDRRLKLDFGPEYGITIRSREGEGTAVTMLIPVRIQEGAHVPGCAG
jgi:two-component system sensor histidine kinase YesM